MRKLRLRSVKSYAQGEDWNLGLPDPKTAGVSQWSSLIDHGPVGLGVLGGGVGSKGFVQSQLSPSWDLERVECRGHSLYFSWASVFSAKKWLHVRLPAVTRL